MRKVIGGCALIILAVTICVASIPDPGDWKGCYDTCREICEQDEPCMMRCMEKCVPEPEV